MMAGRRVTPKAPAARPASAFLLPRTGLTRISARAAQAGPMISLDASQIATLFGTSSGSTGTTTGDPAAAIRAFRAAEAPGAEAKGIAQENKDPVTITALAQFRKALASAKDIGTALKDPRILAVLLPAMGLADQAAYPGLVQKALLADPNATNGLLANLDSRFKTAATTLNLRTKGLAGLRDPATQTLLTDGYVQYQYQTGLDGQNAGMSDALYFVKNASGAKDVYSILGNAVLRRVVTGALGLPSQIAIQPVETQAAAITSRLRLTDLQNATAVQKLAQRYVMNQAGSSTGTASSPLLSLLA